MLADSDAVLVARVVAADDRAAFELLVRRHQSGLRGFLRRLVRQDAARADDLAQETFIKLYRSIGSYRGQAKFGTWLYGIAYNTFLDEQRNRASRAGRQIDAPDVAADMAALAGMELDARKILAHLPERQRAVFDLFYNKDMTHDEVANSLQIPVGTVKSDLYRGIERLKQLAGGAA